MRRLLTIVCALAFVVALGASSFPAAAAEKKGVPQLGTDKRHRKPDPPHVQGGGGGTPQPQGSGEEEKGSGDDFGKKVEPKDDGQPGPKK